MITRKIFKLFFVLALCFAYDIALASDQEEATKAARDILTSLRNKDFNKLWDTQTSELFKKNITKDSFKANMTMGRAQLGTPGESKFIDMAYSQSDPTSGFKGEIYAFNYLSTYSAGNFYERIVVVKDKDGKFRMSGLWGAPAQK